MAFPVRLEGPAVAEYLSGHNIVRDGTLLGVEIVYCGDKPVIQLKFKAAERNGGCIVMLELKDVVEFHCSYEAEKSGDQIELVKCLWTDDGEFYLSLDPYDEGEKFISDQDGEYFRARKVTLTASKPL